jgi:hypothetical protein
MVLFEGTFPSFFKDKVKKKSQNCRNQGFSYYFCLLIEGSGSGSIPLTSGSGSLWPKNDAATYRCRTLWKRHFPVQ